MTEHARRRRGNGFATYDLTIRLGGSLKNEVRKHGITAPEVMVLGAIHGSDGIANLTPCKEHTDDRTDNQERDRLARVYESSGPGKRGFVQRVFGPPTIPLPRELAPDYRAGAVVPLQSIPAQLADVIDPAAALMT